MLLAGRACAGQDFAVPLNVMDPSSPRFAPTARRDPRAVSRPWPSYGRARFRSMRMWRSAGRWSSRARTVRRAPGRWCSGLATGVISGKGWCRKIRAQAEGTLCRVSNALPPFTLAWRLDVIETSARWPGRWQAAGAGLARLGAVYDRARVGAAVPGERPGARHRVCGARSARPGTGVPGLRAS